MKRPDYQNLGDNLEEITDRRNAEIRAWGKQILADSDALNHPEIVDQNHWSDWEQEAGDAPETTQELLEETLSPEIKKIVEKANDDVESGKSTAKPRIQKVVATS